MAHIVVKIKSDDSGDKIKYGKWCLSVFRLGGQQALCNRQFYGVGEIEYEVKSVERGGVTCPYCLSQIREIKAINL
jgi:hypothetical protein